MSRVSKTSRSHPFHVAILRLVIALVLLTAGGIGLLTYRNTQQAVEQLSHELIQEAAGQTVARTEAFLGTAAPALDTLHWLLRSDARYGALAEHPPAGQPWRARAALFSHILKANPSFDWVYYGDRWGDFTAAYREAGGRLFIDHRWLAGGRTRREVYRVNRDETWTPVPRPVRPYDARRRPWYVAARAAPGVVWTPPYLFYEPQRPGITAARGLRDATDQTAGVLAIDFELDPLSRFVQSLQGRRSGRAFILSEDGHVVAQPGGIPMSAAPTVAGSSLPLLPDARRSPDPVLREAALHIPRTSADHRSRLRGPENAPAAAGMEFDAAGTGYLGGVYPFEVDPGQWWMVVVVVSKSEVLSVVHRNNLFTLLICAVVLAAAIAAGGFLSMQISRPLRAFAEEMRQVEQFIITDKAMPTSAIEEVDVMGRALGRMKTGLRSFAKYVPADLVRLLHHSGQEARLGGHTARLTLFVADVVGFSAISEQMAPDALVDTLADYLEEMEGIIGDHGGIVDKYEGDAILALWGSPIRPETTPEIRACAAALQSLDRFQRLRARREAEGHVVFQASMAIHTGEALIGNIGSQRRMNYTAMGDAVNVAHRLEGLTRVYGVRVLISETVFAAVRETYEARRIDRVAVKGRRGAIDIYELLTSRGALDERRRLLRDRYGEGLHLYQARDWPSARERFFEAVCLDPDDGPSRAMLARCEEYLHSPPPATWDGVHVLTSK
jgi:adenylate cyclase